ncbi:MAG: 50S ribosomal protein L4 [Gemmatimonadota bacterium]|nr:MAG: 50S ribosomal protein L4 [Gemmatimonadota bacterium]
MTASLKARYFKADGKAGSARTLPADPFDGVVHEESLHAAVKAHLANRRQGTAAAKTRSQVRGGGRKPWRQKGTGRARVGSIRSPIWRGGGVVFPPTPRSYRIDLPKKVRRLAKRSAFNARASEDRVIVLEDLVMESPKTRELAKLLDKLGIAEEKVLILTAGPRQNVFLSARNLPNVEVQPYGNESAYDVLWADSVVIEESALRSHAKSASEEVTDA